VVKNVIEASAAFEQTLAELLRDRGFRTNELFRVPAIRDALTRDRYEHLFGAHIATSSSAASSQVTIEHNTDIERMFFADLSKRPDLISNVLSSLNSVRQNASRMHVLSIGARTEAELFSLVNAGFALNHIECVDLFSYSPHIKIGDIHQLDYADSSFDVVVCGWVLEFCSDVAKACSEIKRVVKPGGIICIGGMHHPSSTNMRDYNKHKQHDDRAWYCSIPAVKAHFGVVDADFIFKSDIEPDDTDKRGEVIAVFKKAAGRV
jgi:hypothetical protein